MSIALLETGAQALGELTAEVVFVGGATLSLWVTDPQAPPARPTKDVDVIVEVTSRAGWHSFEQRLRDAGFNEDELSGVICRWGHIDSGLILDVMPMRADLLGFANRWQAAAVPHALERELPSGATIRAVSPPFLLATKLEAFRGRGRGDFYGSHDFSDVVFLIDVRRELLNEVRLSPPELQDYIAAELRDLVEQPRFLDGLFGALRPDPGSQARAEGVVLPRVRELISQG